ncbi:MAG: hypothetical protein Q9183_004372 [Haloplaca sp. 2 TL-2023]
MASSKTANKLRRVNKILQNSFPALDPCDCCRRYSRECLFISDFSIMSCANCTRMGKPCVTSSVDRLDKVAEDLANKISVDEKDASKMTDELLSLLEKIQRVKARIARNKAVQAQNNQRLEEQVRHMVENLPVEEENAGFSEAIRLGRSLEAVGAEDPFRWDFVPDDPSSSTGQVS